LIKRGALRWLRDAKQRIPFNVAAERGHSHLLPALEPPQPPLDPSRLHELDLRLADLIYGGRYDDLFADVLPLEELGWQDILRYPPVEILPEFPKQQVWVPMPNNHAGLRITLHQGFLEVISWNCAKKGSGRAHVVTAHDITEVDHGFI
jgi:hypothetical protein